MSAKLISNTGPLIALSIIDRIGILRSLFSAVAVPEAVHNEIMEGGPRSSGVANYMKAKWIEVMALTNPIDPLLRTSLDVGEAAVIGLARELDTGVVLIDERKARKIARAVYGIDCIGSVGVLVRAKGRGLLDSIGAEIEAMRDGGYWISDSIVAAALKQAGEA